MKNQALKKTVIEWGLILSAMAVLYFNGWHTEVIGKVQQGILFSGLFDASAGKGTDANRNPKKGPEADFSLKLRNQEGQAVNLEEFRGKVVFINFWATWCPPCIAEMPSIDELSKKINENEVIFLMVSLDENFNKAKIFHKRKGFSFDVHELAGDLPKMYYSQSIPATFVISGDGKLVYSKKGMADYNTPEFQQFLKDQQ